MFEPKYNKFWIIVFKNKNRGKWIANEFQGNIALVRD